MQHVQWIAYSSNTHQARAATCGLYLSHVTEHLWLADVSYILNPITYEAGVLDAGYMCVG